MTELTWFFIGLAVVQLVIGAAVVLFRLAKGPTALDRVVAAPNDQLGADRAIGADPTATRQHIGIQDRTIAVAADFDTMDADQKMAPGDRENRASLKPAAQPETEFPQPPIPIQAFDPQAAPMATAALGGKDPRGCPGAPAPGFVRGASSRCLIRHHRSFSPLRRPLAR